MFFPTYLYKNGHLLGARSLFEFELYLIVILNFNFVKRRRVETEVIVARVAFVVLVAPVASVAVV